MSTSIGIRKDATKPLLSGTNLRPTVLSKSFIRDPLFLSSKNGHKNHLRNFWSEKCPFFAICGKVWVSSGYKILTRIFVWFLKIRATFLLFLTPKRWIFLWGISEFLCWIPELLWVIRKFLYRIFGKSKSKQKFLKSAFYFDENPVSKLFTFSSIFFTLPCEKAACQCCCWAKRKEAGKILAHKKTVRSEKKA